MQIITPSRWLANLVKNSFLQDYPVDVIYNGVNIEEFRPDVFTLPANFPVTEKKIVLGVASVWDKRKGLEDFVKLNRILNNDYRIVLVGLDESQLKDLPSGITGIARTENLQQLAALYGAADVFVNPTWQDNFPTTNIESLACGTPVVTYNTGGSPEAIDDGTGIVVEKGDVKALKMAIEQIIDKDKSVYQDMSRNRALKFFNKEHRFQEYVNLYDRMIQ